MYSLAVEIAKDPLFDVMFWVDGDVPRHRVKHIKLISQRSHIQRGVPLISRLINHTRSEKIARLSRGGVVIFTVYANREFIAYSDVIRRCGGKVMYRIASDIDLKPEERHGTTEDPFIAALLKADSVIAQTPYQQREAMARYGLNTTLIPTAYYGRASESLEKESILWVGQSAVYRRPWVVLELARAFPEERFVMVMPPVDTMLASVITKSAKQIPNLTILDYVPVDEMQFMFDRAKLVLNTAMFEGFPNTFLQTAQARSPYISLKWNPDNFLEQNSIGFGCDDSIETMKKRLKELLEDQDLRAEIGDNAFHYLEKEHCAETSIERYKSLILNLCN